MEFADKDNSDEQLRRENFNRQTNSSTISSGSSSSGPRPIPIIALSIITLAILSFLGWSLVLVWTGSNQNEWIMFLSNASFLILTILNAYLGLYFDALIWYGVFQSSNLYHICYGYIMDLSFKAQYGMLCASVRTSNVYGIMMIDIIFANMANVNTFIKLMPITKVVERNTNYVTFWRHVLVLLTPIVVVLSTLIDGSSAASSLEIDNSSHIVIAVGVYLLLLFAMHLAFFMLDWKQCRFKVADFKEYYRRNFYMSRVFIGIGILIGATIVWKGILEMNVDNVFPFYYFNTHPEWHVLGVVAAIVGGILGYRYTTSRDESIFDRVYEDSRRVER